MQPGQNSIAPETLCRNLGRYVEDLCSWAYLFFRRNLSRKQRYAPTSGT
jgi:hypothetical protein